MLYTGLGFARGSGNAKTGLSDNIFKHQAISTSLNLGIKYRTREGILHNEPWDWGFSIIYGHKSTAHTVNASTNTPYFNTATSTTEHNLSLGMNVYF